MRLIIKQKKLEKNIKFKLTPDRTQKSVQTIKRRFRAAAFVGPAAQLGTSPPAGGVLWCEDLARLTRLQQKNLAFALDRLEAELYTGEPTSAVTAQRMH